MAKILLIVNLNSGDGIIAKRLVEDIVCPMLYNSKVDLSLHFTASAQEAGDLAEQHIASTPDPETPTILVAGGDGTLHDLVNVLHSRASSGTFPDVNFVLLPTGTANALYYSFCSPIASDPAHPSIPNGAKEEDLLKLTSLVAYIGKTRRRAMGVARTSIYESSSSHPMHTILSLVVNSTSLHAATLDSAEKYRSTIPGIERFKVAAAENVTKWTNAEAELLPILGADDALIWVPKEAEFVPVHDSSISVSLSGPFFYFLSTINVDRLEPRFVTTPLVKQKPAESGQALDLVIVRPSRNPKFAGDSETERRAFVELVLPWFKAVYTEGSHLGLAYESEGAPVYMTEYYRVGGWRWTPKVPHLDMLSPIELTHPSHTE